MEFYDEFIELQLDFIDAYLVIKLDEFILNLIKLDESLKYSDYEKSIKSRKNFENVKLSFESLLKNGYIHAIKKGEDEFFTITSAGEEYLEVGFVKIKKNRRLLAEYLVTILGGQVEWFVNELE